MVPLIIAHRGASGYLPEHTLEAKQLAHEMGADFLEQDVVATRDDELVVLHDIHLDRVTDVATRFAGRKRDDGRYYVRDFNLAELRDLRVWERMRGDGNAVYPHRYPARSGEFRIHTFAEEIALIKRLNAESGRSVGLYTEIKRPAWHREQGADITPQLLDVIAAHGYSHHDDSVFVQCFDPAELLRLKRELHCPWRLVQLIGDNLWREADVDFRSLKTDAGLAQIAEVADAIGPWLPQLYDPGPSVGRVVASAHDLGLDVHAYTFRSDELPPGFSDFEELVRFFAVDIGVDGMFTDFPDSVKLLLNEMPA